MTWRGEVGLGVDAWLGEERDDQSARGSGGGLPPRGLRCERSEPRNPSDQAPPPDQPPPDPQADGPDADAEAVARRILLDQLTGRARSRRELADKLASKQVPPELATALLDRFEEVGLVDDEAFARSWVTARTETKGLGRRALAQELRRKGVADEVAREALDDVPPEAEEEAARTLVRKKLRSLARVDEATATRRLVGMLARKGHPPGRAYAVVREELAAAGRSGSHDDGGGGSSLPPWED